jgi:hypothetical protein
MIELFAPKIELKEGEWVKVKGLYPHRYLVGRIESKREWGYFFKVKLICRDKMAEKFFEYDISPELVWYKGAWRLLDNYVLAWLEAELEIFGEQVVKRKVRVFKMSDKEVDEFKTEWINTRILEGLRDERNI